MTEEPKRSPHPVRDWPRPAEPVDVLLVGAGFGGGHNQSAWAVREALDRVWPGVRAHVLDYLDLFPALGPVTAKGYVAMTKYWPRAYGFFHDLTGQFAPHPAWRGAVGQVGERDFWAVLQRFDPAVLVLTHPLPATVAAGWRRAGLNVPPTILVVTDYSVHPQWAQPGLDHYCVPNREVADTLVRAGVDPGRIELTGIPVRQAFWDPPARDAARTRWNLPPSDSVVLFLGSALGGLGGVSAACRRLVVGVPDARLVVVTGRDRRLKARLDHFAARVGTDRLRVLGYVTDVAGLLAAADVLVTKAGGLTLSEALAVGVATVIYRPIPGHEQDNAAWLARRDAALVTDRAEELAAAVRSLVHDPTRRAALAAAARALGRPRAALAVAETVRAYAPRRTGVSG
ncbi:MAG: glycosyltransferase [Actinomycetia bacterium]|nr:glycosyltransferase [Actinomycetes bacterium]